MKENKKASLDKKKLINAKVAERTRPAKGQDNRKVHDTKGRNTHGRSY
jgi:hypothetical protein